MIALPLDVCTPGVTVSLGSGDTAMFVVAVVIVAICVVPFMFGGRRRQCR